jgi:hypothetical protein
VGGELSLPARIRRQVSIGGGASPEWGEGSAEVIYLSDDRRLMSARLTAAPLPWTWPRRGPCLPFPNIADVDQVAFPTGQQPTPRRANGQRFLVARARPRSQRPAHQHRRQLAGVAEP